MDKTVQGVMTALNDALATGPHTQLSDYATPREAVDALVAWHAGVERAALEAEVSTLRAQVMGHRVNYRRCAQQLAGLTSALLSASEAE